MVASHRTKSNPFYQPPQQWQIRVTVHRDAVAATEEAFGDIAFATSSFEVVEDSEDWYVDIITATPPGEAAIETRLALVSGLLGTGTPRADVRLIEAKDWVSEVEKGFPPLSVGRFYVHGSHVQTPAPHGKITLEVNAGAAFGSGEHATTSGCLLALDRLAKRRRFLRPLDMGCGSGILAIAMARLWHVPVLGVDIDPVSVQVARENAVHNEVRALTDFAAGDGYNTQEVRANAPFDIIVANILARPLVRMAPLLAEYLEDGGVAVLSGLLATQERMVLSAHRVQGLRLTARVCRSGWNTLILAKGSPLT